ncbi:LicD family protein [Pseudothauera nasutitermitis]|nr:LicD family protein [Pseudothauera nasutitermitis]
MKNPSLGMIFPDERNIQNSTLRGIQFIELRMLKIVDYICTKHGLVYWLDGGTLLGAVRHGGFIPWDDDVDIVMPRRDFDRFMEVARKELPSDLEIDPATGIIESDYSVPCRIRDKYSRIVDTQSPVHEQRGLFIDVLPCDDFHRSNPMLMMDLMCKSIYRNLLKIYMPPSRGAFRPVAIAINRILQLLAPVITAETPIKVFRAFSRKFLIKSKFRESGNGNPGYGFDVRWTRVFKRDHIYPVERIVFEGSEFFAPKNPDGVLRVFYGDEYMTPHPPSKRSAKHFSSVILDTRLGSASIQTISDDAKRT